MTVRTPGRRASGIIVSDEEFAEALRHGHERIREYAEKYPEVYASQCANRERESEAERWGDDSDGASALGVG